MSSRRLGPKMKKASRNKVQRFAVCRYAPKSSYGPESVVDGLDARCMGQRPGAGVASVCKGICSQPTEDDSTTSGI